MTARVAGGRGLGSSLVVHAVAATAILFGVSAAVGWDGYFFIDEAAFYAQLEVLQDGSWVVAEPAIGDGSGPFEPAMARAHPVEGGFAPFAKHPAHVLVAHAADDLAGRAGVRALSTLGAIVAGVGAALAASRSGRRPALLALWITVLASPLVFHAQLVVGHALAAGISALLLWRWTATARPSLHGAVLCVGLGAAGVLVRSEFALLLAAGVAVAVLAARADRGLARLAVSVPAAAGGLAAYLAEPLLVEGWVGGSASAAVVSSGSRGGTDGFLAGLRTALLQPDFARPGALSPLTTMLAVLLAGATLVLLRRTTSDRPLLFATAAGALAAAVLHLGEPDIVPGVVWAFPALWLAVGLRRADLRLDAAGAPPLVAGLFAALVLVTQYEVAGGGLEWGWRYVAIAVPWVAPALALGAVRLRDRASGHRLDLVAFAAVLAALLLVPASGLLEQRRYLRDTQYFLDRVDDLASDVDVIVALDPSFGRLAYPATLDGRVVRTRAGELDAALDELTGRDSRRIAVLWRDELPDGVDLEGLGGGDQRDIAGGYRAVVLEPNVRSPA